MRFAVFCVVVLISVVLCPRAYSLSETADPKYFDFVLLKDSLSQNILKDGQIITIEFTWNIKDFNMTEQKRLTVKPFISAGAVEIYNEDLKKFTGTADFNSQLPYLQKQMLLKFSGVQGLETPASLYFYIFDTLTGQEYETSDKKIWGIAYYNKYTDLLNESILKDANNEEEPAGITIDTVKPADNKPKDPVKIYLWYLSPALFLYGLLKSTNVFGSFG